MAGQAAHEDRRRSVDDILARADELAARFESEDFDGDRLSPEEYERLQARIKPPRDV